VPYAAVFAGKYPGQEPLFRFQGKTGGVSKGIFSQPKDAEKGMIAKVFESWK
jgi:hypothetical protein